MNETLALIGIARKANMLLYGDKLSKSIKTRSIKLVVFTNDATERSKKHLISQCEYYKVIYLVIDDGFALSQAIGKENIKVVGITDEGIADRILKTKRNEVG